MQTKCSWAERGCVRLDNWTTYCPEVVGTLQKATMKGIPDKNLLLQYPSEHDCWKHLRAKFVTAKTSKASSLFSDPIPASTMRESVQTLYYRARNAEMLFSWNDEAPVWAPKFRALLHEAACTSFFLCFCNVCRILIFMLVTVSIPCQNPDSAACRPFWGGGAVYSSGSVFALSNNTLANNAASGYGGRTINDEPCDLIQSLGWHGS